MPISVSRGKSQELNCTENALADVMPDVQDEIAKAFDAAWPACDGE